jgi:hypothetical protein
VIRLSIDVAPEVDAEPGLETGRLSEDCAIVVLGITLPLAPQSK